MILEGRKLSKEQDELLFYATGNKEIMRISRDGIWVNPEVEPIQTASQVIQIMDSYIKSMMKAEWNAAIDACIDHLENKSSSIVELKK